MASGSAEEDGRASQSLCKDVLCCWERPAQVLPLQGRKAGISIHCNRSLLAHFSHGRSDEIRVQDPLGGLGAGRWCVRREGTGISSAFWAVSKLAARQEPVPIGPRLLAAAPAALAARGELRLGEGEVRSGSGMALVSTSVTWPFPACRAAGVCGGWLATRSLAL